MAEVKNLFIDQGTSFSVDVDIVDDDGLPFDLTGYSSRSKFKKTYNSSNSVTITTALFSNSTVSKITLSMTASQTANVAAGRYVYDAEIFITGPDVCHRVVEGTITILPEVTR